jgi:ATP-dependent RNA helicase RhlE
MSFHELGLVAKLLRNVEVEGYKTPTPIQTKTIPLALEGRDILAGAQTGTGKTAAFALPILQKLSGETSHQRQKEPRALILTPTRELAVQVSESFRTYGRGVRLKTAVVYGGVGYHPQMANFKKGIDILVATPGRLLDHLNQGNVDLSKVEILVLDEGDRMLDMGFIHDIRKIMNFLPKKRQNMLFSATYTGEVRKLAGGLLHDPERIDVAKRNTAAETVHQVVHPVAKDQKKDLLSHLIRKESWDRVLVFTKTKHGANRLATQLKRDGVRTEAIHGNKSQAARAKALDNFKRGKINTLVATDVASRGLDIDMLPYVVNYDLPHVPEDYIHRIGRTGRAGESGKALSLVSFDERNLLRDIEKLLQKKIQIENVEGFEPEYSHIGNWSKDRSGGEKFIPKGRKVFRGQKPRRSRRPAF